MGNEVGQELKMRDVLPKISQSPIVDLHRGSLVSLG
jgi:hypothetical protein